MSVLLGANDCACRASGELGALESKQAVTFQGSRGLVRLRTELSSSGFSPSQPLFSGDEAGPVCEGP